MGNELGDQKSQSAAESINSHSYPKSKLKDHISGGDMHFTGGQRSFMSFQADNELLDTFNSVDATRVLERSLAPSRDTVFLTWHSINFIVPMNRLDR